MSKATQAIAVVQSFAVVIGEKTLTFPTIGEAQAALAKEEALVEVNAYLDSIGAVDKRRAGLLNSISDFLGYRAAQAAAAQEADVEASAE